MWLGIKPWWNNFRIWTANLLIHVSKVFTQLLICKKLNEVWFTIGSFRSNPHVSLWSIRSLSIGRRPALADFSISRNGGHLSNVTHFPSVSWIDKQAPIVQGIPIFFNQIIVSYVKRRLTRCGCQSRSCKVNEADSNEKFKIEIFNCLEHGALYG